MPSDVSENLSDKRPTPGFTIPFLSKEMSVR